MEKVRLGILGTGRIVARVMTDMGNTENIEITAIASRDIERARAAAGKYGIANAYGSYLQLAQSDKVDLIYIATPHPFHAEQACLMMEHGKHVICEKPMTMNVSQILTMAECAKRNGVFLMEALWTRFMPAMKEAVARVRAGEIGEVRHIYGEFSWRSEVIDTSDRLFDPALAGGALLDLGVYPLMGITQFLGFEPEKVQGMASLTPQGVDMRTVVSLMYANGATAQLMCGMDACGGNSMTVYGAKGRLELPGFWHSVGYTICVNGKEPETRSFAPEYEGHHYQFDHAAECIRAGMTGSPVVSLEESIALSRICTQVREQVGVRYPGE